MIEMTERAQEYFNRLLVQQDIDGLGIRLRVSRGGTPAADCELEFCERNELNGDEWIVECRQFQLYVQGESVKWLRDASIDFEPNATGGQLNIRAPSIKGYMPDADAGMVERVKYVIDAEINPQVASHGGRISLIEVTSAGVVVLQFGGGCHGCGMVDVTLKQGVEKTLKARVPEISAVRDATDHTTGENPYYERKNEGGTSPMA